jgi:hypothetical protein
MMVLSLGVAARIVARFGPKRPLVYGLLLFGLGMLLMARALAVLAGVAAVRTSGLLRDWRAAAARAQRGLSRRVPGSSRSVAAERADQRHTTGGAKSATP